MARSSTSSKVQPEDNTLSVGIDISKATFNVALYHLDAIGADSYSNRSFANTTAGVNAFLHYLKQQAQAAPLCMEATGRYWELLAHRLHQAGHTVSIVNPARLKAYIKAAGWHTKTDKADAQYIAHFCAKQSPEPWRPPSPERRELQALSRHLEDLKQERTRTLNRIKALPPSELVCKSLDEMLQQLEERIARIEKEAEQLTSRSAEFAVPVKLLLSIPGIGLTTAVHLLAEMPDIANFTSVRQLTAYAGLNPSIRQSGTSLRKSSLSKQGNRHLRAALYFSAVSAMDHNSLVTPLVTRMREKGKAMKQRIAAAMRKLLHIVYGILKSGTPFNAALATTPNLT